MDSTKPVLIVGAGPCGLVMACELLRLGVPVRVLDAAAEPATGSRAIILWPPTMEVFGELGVLEQACDRGVRARAMTYHMGEGKPLRLELGSGNEPLLLPQEETGRLLVTALDRLGGKVEHSVRVHRVVDNGNSVTVEVEGPAGQEVIEADWLIGADGVGSTVRGQLGIDFAGDNVPSTFLLAEGEVVGEYAQDEVHYFLGPAGVLLLSPLPGGKVRLAGPVDPALEITEQAVQLLLDQRGPGNLTFTNPSTLGTFTSQERIAAALRRNRTFLVGDAAHVHSAVGGQGLNLGLQDGRNLAWKLAGVISGELRPSVLDSYDPERRAAAEQVMRATSRMTKMAVVGPVATRMRNAMWSMLEVTGMLRRWYAPMLAGWLTRYPDVLFGARPDSGKGRGPRALPRPGTRTPSWVPVPAEAGTTLRLVTLGEVTLPRFAAELVARYPATVTHKHLPGRAKGFLLLRPDGFVAASGTSAETLDELVAVLAADTVRAPDRHR